VLAHLRQPRHISVVQDPRRTKHFLLLILGAGLLVVCWQAVSRGKLTVYCAHDAVFADAILRDFEKKTGIPVVVKYDTEATKSLGLVEQIIRDGAKPRADLLWNNELLGTADLAERNLLEPYQGDGWKRIPAAFRDPEGKWAGFAARLRVVIRHKGSPAPPSLMDSGDLSGWALAKPLYGTTLTHYTVLWWLWGSDRLKHWHSEIHRRGVREVNGNGPVKDVVAAGTCAAGWTDTDDYFAGLDAAAPVTAEPIRLENGKTICIPNTVAILKNCDHLEYAQKLADFLLSEQTELALAKSKSRQIPLGPVKQEDLPAEVRALLPAAADGVALTTLLPARRACLEWLKQEYAK
jgi:iron(III) transport system substrate-binding protein